MLDVQTSWTFPVPRSSRSFTDPTLASERLLSTLVTAPVQHPLSAAVTARSGRGRFGFWRYSAHPHFSRKLEIRAIPHFTTDDGGAEDVGCGEPGHMVIRTVHHIYIRVPHPNVLVLHPTITPRFTPQEFQLLQTIGQITIPPNPPHTPQHLYKSSWAKTQ